MQTPRIEPQQLEAFREAFRTGQAPSAQRDVSHYASMMCGNAVSLITKNAAFGEDRITELLNKADILPTGNMTFGAFVALLENRSRDDDAARALPLDAYYSFAAVRSGDLGAYRTFLYTIMETTEAGAAKTPQMIGRAFGLNDAIAACTLETRLMRHSQVGTARVGRLFHSLSGVQDGQRVVPAIVAGIAYTIIERARQKQFLLLPVAHTSCGDVNILDVYRDPAYRRLYHTTLGGLTPYAPSSERQRTQFLRGMSRAEQLCRRFTEERAASHDVVLEIVDELSGNYRRTRHHDYQRISDVIQRLYTYLRPVATRLSIHDAPFANVPLASQRQNDVRANYTPPGAAQAIPWQNYGLDAVLKRGTQGTFFLTAARDVANGWWCAKVALFVARDRVYDDSAQQDSERAVSEKHGQWYYRVTADGNKLQQRLRIRLRRRYHNGKQWVTFRSSETAIETIDFPLYQDITSTSQSADKLVYRRDGSPLLPCCLLTTKGQGFAKAIIEILSISVVRVKDARAGGGEDTVKSPLPFQFRVVQHGIPPAEQKVVLLTSDSAVAVEAYRHVEHTSSLATNTAIGLIAATAIAASVYAPFVSVAAQLGTGAAAGASVQGLVSKAATRMQYTLADELNPFDAPLTHPVTTRHLMVTSKLVLSSSGDLDAMYPCVYPSLFDHEVLSIPLITALAETPRIDLNIGVTAKQATWYNRFTQNTPSRQRTSATLHSNGNVLICARSPEVTHGYRGIHRIIFNQNDNTTTLGLDEHRSKAMTQIFRLTFLNMRSPRESAPSTPLPYVDLKMESTDAAPDKYWISRPVFYSRPRLRQRSKEEPVYQLYVTAGGDAASARLARWTIDRHSPGIQPVRAADVRAIPKLGDVIAPFATVRPTTTSSTSRIGLPLLVEAATVPSDGTCMSPPHVLGKNTYNKHLNFPIYRFNADVMHGASPHTAWIEGADIISPLQNAGGGHRQRSRRGRFSTTRLRRIRRITRRSRRKENSGAVSRAAHTQKHFFSRRTVASRHRKNNT